MYRVSSLILVALLVAGCQHVPPPPPAPSARIVNLGDSITDGQTYAVLVEQALREAGQPVPRFYGAGIGMDASAGMLQRLDRDVLVHHPTQVMLMTGINDLATGTTLAQYESNLTAIVAKLQAAKVDVMLLTVTTLPPKFAGEEPALVAVNNVMRKVAELHHLTVAEVHAAMQAGYAQEKDLWTEGAHLNLAGYRYVARAVLDALGHRDVPVPTVLRPALLPGVLPAWQVLPITDDRPGLDAAAVAALKVDAQWQPLSLPQTAVVSNWWKDQERQRGVAVELARQFGAAKRFVAVTTVMAKKPRAAVVNLGSDNLRSVWLNGTRLFGPGDPNRGWHPGAYRIPVQLQAGANRLVVETGNDFFVSVTENADW